MMMSHIIFEQMGEMEAHILGVSDKSIAKT